MDNHNNFIGNKNVGPVARFIVFGALILVIVCAAFVILPMYNGSVNLRFGHGIFKARLALTDESRQKGLSGQTAFSKSDALLMVFPDNQKPSIWMKDMKIPIDIVWLNNKKRVIYIVKNAQPDTGDLKTYQPKETARYVIEFSAGTVDDLDIGLKDEVICELDESSVK